MKTSNFGLLLIIIQLMSCSAQDNSEFKFPDNKLGQCAYTWFGSINSDDNTFIEEYDPMKEWTGYFESMRSISKKNNGLKPYLLSYQTNNSIAIHAKEINGGYVRVILGLVNDNEIGQMSIRKSFKVDEKKPRDQLTSTMIKEITKGISKELLERYVIKKQGIIYSEKFSMLANSGKYDSITQVDLFAELVTKDIVDITYDKHLQVIPPYTEEVKIRFGMDSSETEIITERDNNIVISSELASGDIGIIELSRFIDDDVIREETLNAFKNIKEAKAVIVDIRNSGGGDGLAMEDLLSYFIPSDSIKNNEDKLLKEKFNKIPLYVLTSNKTISAGEAFAYKIKETKRGEIVGEVTAGAGYRVNVFELPFYFYFVNSIYTSFDLKRGEGWQGKGIVPDFRIKASQSLDFTTKKIMKEVTKD